MMEKYIIEVPKYATFSGLGFIRQEKENGIVSMSFKKIADFTPLQTYIAPIKQEAYKEGADDAWNLVKRLLSDEFDCVELKQIFGTSYLGDIREILNRYSPLEVSEKIAEYKKQKEIRIGDEVEVTGVIDGRSCIPFIVTNIKNNETVFGLFHDGTATIAPLKTCKRTGRHFDEVSNFLKEIKE